MRENSKNLLPCPFCGGEPELKHMGRHYGASCADWKCQGMQGALMHLEAGSAISAWNRRAAEAYSAEKSPAPEGGEAGGTGVSREHRAPASSSVGGRIQFANVDDSAMAKDTEAVIQLVATKVGGLFACIARGMEISATALDEARDAVNKAVEMSTAIAASAEKGEG
ncbi:Lar family restriction alleviation protein [Paraburkholderia largidicola]|uniref:Restriction alleviation protein, Lar family n=1 Tax=Paraburkholderia largidicola TaxID=3014751 RepID=A0A7I8BJ57_9BURK|nr:Lar family restriction alleviation protein [Paraburkholderia sp. PGU16]BCF88726.1 hypothetical protein PPGU16_17930 [Paraburkholderia sp. PGU16]